MYVWWKGEICTGQSLGDGLPSLCKKPGDVIFLLEKGKHKAWKYRRYLTLMEGDLFFQTGYSGPK